MFATSISENEWAEQAREQYLTHLFYYVSLD